MFDCTTVCAVPKLSYFRNKIFKSKSKINYGWGNIFFSLAYLATGGKKRSIPFRRQRMQIDELLPQSSTSGYPASQPDDPYIADLLQLADGRFAFLCDISSVIEESGSCLIDVCIYTVYVANV